MNISRDRHITSLLNTRSGIETFVQLADITLVVWNIAWGYDIGDEFAHITTNISPFIEGYDVDFFYTDEIMQIFAPEINEILYSSSA